MSDQQHTDAAPPQHPQSRVARTPSVEEALRRLTNSAPPEPIAADDVDLEAITHVEVDTGADHGDQHRHEETLELDDLDDDAGLDDFDGDAGFDDIDDLYETGGIEETLSIRRQVKRHMGPPALNGREGRQPPSAEPIPAEPIYAPVVDVDVLLAALHGGDDEPLRRLSAIAIASERDAILASAKAQAQLLVSEARSHRRSILARAEAKSEIMIARAEAQAAATVARAEARAQLLELETRNQQIAMSNRRKRKQR